MDPGVRVVETVVQGMQIDREWSVRNERGFAWWGHRQAQRVWAEPARQSFGMAVYRVHAETDVLRNMPETFTLLGGLALVNTHASLSTLLYEPRGGCVRLRSTVVVHEQNIGWTSHLLSAAVALQADDGARIAEDLAGVLGGEADISHHPSAGPRPVPDEMLLIVERFFVPSGWAGSPVGPDDFRLTLEVNPLGGPTEEANLWLSCSQCKSAQGRSRHSA